MQPQRSPKINFREIFWVVRFSTFATISAKPEHNGIRWRCKRDQFWDIYDRLNLPESMSMKSSDRQMWSHIRSFWLTAVVIVTGLGHALGQSGPLVRPLHLV